MRSSILVILSVVAVFVALAHAECDTENSSEEVKTFFKNLGCKINKGASDLQESAKPWADKIGTAVKDLGSTVAQKYGEIKHKLSDDGNMAADAAAAPLAPVSTEKVPLAPLPPQTISAIEGTAA